MRCEINGMQVGLDDGSVNVIRPRGLASDTVNVRTSKGIPLNDQKSGDLIRSQGLLDNLAKRYERENIVFSFCEVFDGSPTDKFDHPLLFRMVRTVLYFMAGGVEFLTMQMLIILIPFLSFLEPICTLSENYNGSGSMAVGGTFLSVFILAFLSRLGMKLLCNARRKHRTRIMTQILELVKTHPDLELPVEISPKEINGMINWMEEFNCKMNPVELEFCQTFGTEPIPPSAIAEDFIETCVDGLHSEDKTDHTDNDVFARLVRKIFGHGKRKSKKVVNSAINAIDNAGVCESAQTVRAMQGRLPKLDLLADKIQKTYDLTKTANDPTMSPEIFEAHLAQPLEAMTRMIESLDKMSGVSDAYEKMQDNICEMRDIISRWVDKTNDELESKITAAPLESAAIDLNVAKSSLGGDDMFNVFNIESGALKS